MASNEQEPRSILDFGAVPEVDISRPVTRRKRSTCQFCRTQIYVAIGTPDEERRTCRYCLHMGYRPITTNEAN